MYNPDKYLAQVAETLSVWYQIAFCFFLAVFIYISNAISLFQRPNIKSWQVLVGIFTYSSIFLLQTVDSSRANVIE